MRAIGSVLLGALCAVAIACGAASQKSATTGASPPPTATNADAMGRTGSPEASRSEIEKLDAEIRAELARMGLPEPASMGVSPSCENCSPQAMKSQITAPSSDDTCKPGTSDTCRDSCKLADSICSNATKICALAEAMNDDAWANGKCVDGKTSCDNAKKRCCGCQL